eukprot:5772778-Prymnesium_polylepis.2
MAPLCTQFAASDRVRPAFRRIANRVGAAHCDKHTRINTCKCATPRGNANRCNCRRTVKARQPTVPRRCDGWRCGPSCFAGSPR